MIASHGAAAPGRARSRARRSIAARRSAARGCLRLVALLAIGPAPALAADPAPPPQIAVAGMLPFGAADERRAAVEEAVADALRGFSRVHSSPGVRDVLAADGRLRPSLERGKAALAAGLAAFKRVDSARAVEHLSEAAAALVAARAELHDPDPLEQAYLYLGAAHVLESDREAAAGAFKELFRLDPDPVIPKGYFAPDVRAALAEARRWRVGSAPELPDRAVVEEILRAIGADLVAVVSRERSGSLDRMLVYLLRSGAKPVKGWATLEPGADPARTAALAARRAAKALGLRATLPSFSPDAETGSGDAPLADPALSTPAPARRGVLTRWWFWTAAGAVVLGAAAAVVLVVVLPR